MAGHAFFYVQRVQVSYTSRPYLQFALHSSLEVGDHIGRNPLFAKLKGISQHLLWRKKWYANVSTVYGD